MKDGNIPTVPAQTSPVTNTTLPAEVKHTEMYVATYVVCIYCVHGEQTIIIIVITTHPGSTNSAHFHNSETATRDRTARGTAARDWTAVNPRTVMHGLTYL